MLNFLSYSKMDLNKNYTVVYSVNGCFQSLIFK